MTGCIEVDYSKKERVNEEIKENKVGDEEI